MKYYELIGFRDRVMGVCREDSLLHELTENEYIWAVGEITKEQYDSYGDDDWDEMISLPCNRYTCQLITSVNLKPLELIKH